MTSKEREERDIIYLYITVMTEDIYMHEISIYTFIRAHRDYLKEVCNQYDHITVASIAYQARKNFKKDNSFTSSSLILHFYLIFNFSSLPASGYCTKNVDKFNVFFI